MKKQSILNHQIFKQVIVEINALGFSISEHPSPNSIPYAIIGGRSNARWWLVPLNNRHVAVSGLAMFQPVLRTAKIFKRVAVATGSVGLASKWSKKRIYISGSSCLTEIFGDSDLHYAFFTGTDSPHRKVAVQVMERDGSIKGFAKVSCNPEVKPLLVHEAATLNYVYTLDLQTALIPKVLFNGAVGGASVLVTDTLKTGKSKTATTLTDAHRAFLRELSEKTSVPGAADTDWVVSKLRRQYDAVVDRLPEEWQQRLSRAINYLTSSKVVWGARCLSHGDFTPWNTFLVDGKIYVFDWEYASQINLSGCDLAHFIFSLPSIQNQSSRESIIQFREALRESGFAVDDRGADLLFLSYLCMHALHYISRETNVVGNILDWDKKSKFEKYIDSVVAILS